MKGFVRFRKDAELDPHEKPYKTRRGFLRRWWVNRDAPDDALVEFGTRERLWIRSDKLEETER